MQLGLNISSVQKSGKSLAFNLDSEFKNLDPNLQERINNLSNKDFCLFYNSVIIKSKLTGVQELEENDKDKNRSVLTSQLISKVNAKSESGFFYDSFAKIATEVVNRIEKTSKTQASLVSLLGLMDESASKICLDEEIANTNTKTKSNLIKLQEQKKTTNKENPKLRF